MTCPNSITYRTSDADPVFQGTHVTLECQGEAGHPPRCYYQAEDGSRIEFDFPAGSLGRSNPQP